MQDDTLQPAWEKISLKDVANFLKFNWRLIVFWGIAGLFICSAYVSLAPKKHEATWQMQMAQFNKLNIEEPVALIQRLRFPTAYPIEVQQQCGFPEDAGGGDYLGSRLVIQATKGMATAVDMKISARSSAQAKQCAEAIVTMVVAQQRSLIADSVADHQELIGQYQKTLTEEQQQLDKLKNPELALFAYWVRRDEIISLRSKISALQNEILPSRMSAAKFIAYIDVPSKSVTKVAVLFLLGVSFGLMLGVLHALVRKWWREAT